MLPAVGDDDFAPMLVLDAALTGRQGPEPVGELRSAPPQRRSRLYRALVDKGLAAAVGGACVATEDPYLFMVSVTAAAGQDSLLETVEDATLGDTRQPCLPAAGITAEELDRARRQLRAREWCSRMTA